MAEPIQILSRLMLMNQSYMLTCSIVVRLVPSRVYMLAHSHINTRYVLTAACTSRARSRNTRGGKLARCSVSNRCSHGADQPCAITVIRAGPRRRKRLTVRAVECTIECACEHYRTSSLDEPTVAKNVITPS